MFFGIIPIWGFQLLIGIPFAIFFKMNKVLFITAANISIPPAIPFIIYVSYLFGSPFFDNNIHLFSLKSLTLESIHENFVQYMIGAVILAIIAGVVTFFLSYTLFSLFRKGK